MSMFVDYATKSDLASYMGISEESLPLNSEILIKRASELICIAMRSNYNSNDENHVEAAKLATCSQCQNWIENELNGVSTNPVSSYSLGELSVTYSDVDKLSNSLCTSSVKYLNHLHLLYKGMG